MTSDDNCRAELDSGERDIECTHETYGGHDKCIWHLHPEKKSSADVEDALTALSGNVYGAQLAGMDISDVDISGVTFENADFYNGSLRDVTFQNTALDDSTFDEQTSVNVDFKDCSLNGVTFNGSGTRIKNSTFAGNDHRKLEFREAKFENTSFRDIGMVDGSFFDAVFHSGDLSGLSINKGEMSLATFRYTDLINCRFVNVVANSVEFNHGSFADVEIQSRDEKPDMTFDSVEELDLEITGKEAKEVEIIGCSGCVLSISVNRLDRLDITDSDGEQCDISSKSIEKLSVDDFDIGRFRIRSDRIENADIDGIDVEERGELEGVSIDGEQFSDVSLGDGEMSGCEFENIPFTKVSLQNGSITDTDFRNVDFEDAVFVESKFKDISIVDSDLSGSVLTHAKFLGNLSFDDVSLSGCDLRHAELNGVKLAHSNLESSVLSNADLREVDLRGAQLYDIKLHSTRINEDTQLGDISVYEHVADQIAEKGINPDGSQSHHDYKEFKIDRLDSGFNRKNHWTQPLLTISSAIKRFKTRATASEKWRENHSDTLANSSRVYRAYQDLLRENGLPGDIHYYRIREKNARRKRAFVDRDIPTWIRLVFLRWSIGYGERYRNVLINSFLIILGCAILYTGGITELQHSNGGIPNWIANNIINSQMPQRMFSGLYFSVTTFTTLGFGDIYPANDFTRVIAGLQSLVGTALTAVLVYILGRRATW
ncbi:pentapeptide repeat-containing protein [Halorubrum aidingense]|uniref:pentapeptide repeat-containing protein n=1 Tax=Halorubrum aidingense TaxID=368623 RepID=UPI000A85D687|nr:pentapeptide repeat-containing protein [Halorubrum aidingense]